MTEECLLQLLRTALRDPLLSDLALSSEPRLESIAAWQLDAKKHMDQIDELLQVERHEAFSVWIVRLDGERFSIRVAENMTVLALKRRIERVLSARIEERHGRRTIDWKQVWRSNCLAVQGVKMLDHAKTLDMYQVLDGCEIRFVRFIDRSRHSKARHYRLAAI